MKITEIKFTPVSIPYKDAPTLNMPDTCSWGRTRVIVQVLTDEGIVGLGEMPYDRQFGGSIGIEESIEHSLIGEDPFNLNRILQKAGKFNISFYSSIVGLGPRQNCAGIEMACWDIIGKATGKPVCDLLGGMYRDRVPFSVYIYPRYEGPSGLGGEMTSERIVNFASDRVEKFGFKVVKYKAGLFSPKKDVEVMRRMRDVFGDDVGLRIDPQGMWTPQEALWACKRLDQYDLEYIEDCTWGLVGMSRVRREVKTPFSTDGFQFAFYPDFFVFNSQLQPPAVDVLLCDVHWWGGISRSKELGTLCDTFQLGQSFHTGAEFGISTAAVMHVAASTPTARYACDTAYYTAIEPPDILTDDTAWRFEDGCLRVPRRPGLGVEIDDAKVAKYNKIFQTEGLYTWAFDDFKPSWLPTRGEYLWESIPIDQKRRRAWLERSAIEGYMVNKY
jgi:glucarate dehydratase